MQTTPLPTTPTTATKDPERATRSLGVVSFLNALPLYETLSDRPELSIIPAVPARLHELLAAGRCEAALLPVVSFWQARRQLELISDGCIASDGETMTVRVFAKVPPEEVRRLHVDGDSKTSIVLARLLWLELYGRRLELQPWVNGEPSVASAPRGRRARGADAPTGSVPTRASAPQGRDATGATPQTGARGHPRRPRGGDATVPPGWSRTSDADVEAVLLIGDKVVRHALRGFGFEVDLGAAWKHLTGLPFVFAAWYGPIGGDHAELAVMLRSARDAGVTDVERIARAYAPRHGWPADLALVYLRDTMRYTLTADMRAAMERFFQLGVDHGLLP